MISSSCGISIQARTTAYIQMGAAMSGWRNKILRSDLMVHHHLPAPFAAYLEMWILEISAALITILTVCSSKLLSFNRTINVYNLLILALYSSEQLRLNINILEMEWKSLTIDEL